MQKDYLQTLDDLSEIVVIENQNGIIKYVNKAFCKCHGVTVENAIGKSVFDFIIPEDREACKMHNIVTPENSSYKIEGRSKRADGKIIWIQYIGKAFFSEEGELLEFEELGVDITQWKEKINEQTMSLKKVNKALKEAGRITKARDAGALKNDDFGNTAIYTFSDIITCSSKMISLKVYAEAVSKGESSVLIEGESGTGKEMFAQAIHNSSKRANGPFVAVNCGAIPAELVGSEFFGYEGGAFTGAAKEGKPGKFEMASGGTLFLDEIGEMPYEQQVALLRVLETKSVTRLGGSRETPVDIRVICATNKDLLTAASKNTFRSDLYYRINIINLKIPPLRERRDDIFLLTGYFIKDCGRRRFDRKSAFSDEQLIKMYNYHWPGNVRELQNVVERMRFRPKETIEEIMREEQESCRKIEVEMSETTEERESEDEKGYILKLLQEYENNVSMVARKMGISRNTMYKKLHKYQIRNFK